MSHALAVLCLSAPGTHPFIQCLLLGNAYQELDHAFETRLHAILPTEQTLYYRVKLL